MWSGVGLLRTRQRRWQPGCGLHDLYAPCGVVKGDLGGMGWEREHGCAQGMLGGHGQGRRVVVHFDLCVLAKHGFHLDDEASLLRQRRAVHAAGVGRRQHRGRDLQQPRGRVGVPEALRHGVVQRRRLLHARLRCVDANVGEHVELLRGRVTRAHQHQHHGGVARLRTRGQERLGRCAMHGLVAHVHGADQGHVDLVA